MFHPHTGQFHLVGHAELPTQRIIALQSSNRAHSTGRRAVIMLAWAIGQTGLNDERKLFGTYQTSNFLSTVIECNPPFTERTRRLRVFIWLLLQHRRNSV
jgi:hypothetical protein